jgi:DNA-binding IclR family transcriptional regulator
MEFKSVPAVAKCCAMIRLLDERSASGMSLANISAELEVTKSHCLQILRTLEAEGWVVHDPERRIYRLAAALLNDVAALVASNDMAARLQSVVEKLSKKLELPCVITRINKDGSFTMISKAQPASELLVIAPLGFRHPPDAPAQMRARLSAMPADKAAKVLDGLTLSAYTKATIVDRDKLLRDIARSRTRGYAVGRMEYQEGVMTISSAVTDSTGNPTMILQCTAPEGALARREKEVGDAIRSAAALLTQSASTSQRQ